MTFQINIINKVQFNILSIKDTVICQKYSEM